LAAAALIPAFFKKSRRVCVLIFGISVGLGLFGGCY
jgi:hypothetical protein